MPARWRRWVISCPIWCGADTGFDGGFGRLRHGCGTGAQRMANVWQSAIRCGGRCGGAGASPIVNDVGVRVGAMVGGSRRALSRRSVGRVHPATRSPQAPWSGGARKRVGVNPDLRKDMSGFGSGEWAEPRWFSRSCPRRGRLRGPYPVMLVQSGEAWIRRTGRRLAVFVHSSRHCPGDCGTRMVGFRAGRRIWRGGVGCARKMVQWTVFSTERAKPGGVKPTSVVGLERAER